MSRGRVVLRRVPLTPEGANRFDVALMAPLKVRHEALAECPDLGLVAADESLNSRFGLVPPDPDDVYSSSPCAPPAGLRPMAW